MSNFGQVTASQAGSGYGVYLGNGGFVINGQAGAGTSTAAIQGYAGVVFRPTPALPALAR